MKTHPKAIDENRLAGPVEIFAVAPGQGKYGRHIRCVANWQSSPGAWTRRAWNSYTLCGSRSYCVVGGDLLGLAQEAVDMESVDCPRCKERGTKRLKAVSA